MPVTYYVALPFVRNEEGELVAGEAQDRQSASAAESLARRMAQTFAGAVAGARTGEPATGEFENGVVIRSVGEVPSIEALLSASSIRHRSTASLAEDLAKPGRVGRQACHLAIEVGGRRRSTRARLAR